MHWITFFIYCRELEMQQYGLFGQSQRERAESPFPCMGILRLSLLSLSLTSKPTETMERCWKTESMFLMVHSEIFLINYAKKLSPYLLTLRQASRICS